MTQENKELLLKDLCARLPYGIKVHIKGEYHKHHEVEEIDISDECVRYFENWHLYEEKITNCRLYLRPMSSMTEEEKEELKEICSIYIPTDSKNIGFEDYGILVFTHHLTDNSYSFKLNLNVIDWLNAHYFDYCGLIEKGLAIEASEGIYK